MGQGRDKVDGNTKRRPWTPVTKMEDIAYYANRFITGTHHGGPFNKILYKRKYPEDSEEYIYREHDIAYGKYGNKGYFYFNKADQDLLDKLPSGGRNNIARAYFTLKKAVAPTMPEPSNKRLRSGSIEYVDLGTSFNSPQAFHASAAPTATGKPPAFAQGNNIQRYKANKLSTNTKTRGRSASKYKPVPYNPLKMAVDEMRRSNPWVEWKMMRPTLATYTSGIGVQAAQASITAGRPMSAMLRSDLKAIYNKLYVDILRTEVTVAPSIPTTGPSSLGMPDFRCHGWKRTIHFFNPKTTVSYLELYEFVRKNEDGDMTLDPEVMWAQELDKAEAANTGNYGLAEARQNTQVPTIDSTRAYTDPGERPENLPRLKTSNFWKTWGLLRKTRIRLEPTAKYDHTWSIPGFTIKHHELYEPGAAEVIPGISMITMIISIGERCYDNTAGNQRQSYMPTTTTAWYEDDCKFSILKRDQHKYSFVTSVPAEFANAAAPVIAFSAGAPTIATPSYAAVVPDVAQAEVEG